MIEVKTKPSGANNNWLELGKFEVDKFGDKVWKPNVNPRYPNQSKKLQVKREFSNRKSGASQRIYWKIIVPDDYKLYLVQRWGDGEIKVLYTPQGEK